MATTTDTESSEAMTGDQSLSPAARKLKWRYRSTPDIEYAMTSHKGLELQVEDCDGDWSRWHIKRGGQYLACGDEGGNQPYHMDAAMNRVVEVSFNILKAMELNDFIAAETAAARVTAQVGAKTATPS